MQKHLIVLSEIFLKNTFPKEGMPIGLMLYPQLRNKKIRIHCSTILNTHTRFCKKNEGFVEQILLYKRKTLKSKNKTVDLLETADLKRTFPKKNRTNWSYKL